jgi:deoxyribose-phosphate aldolase
MAEFRLNCLALKKLHIVDQQQVNIAQGFLQRQRCLVANCGEPVNATIPFGLVMARQIREYRQRTGYLVGLKPAGGIRTAKQSLDWLAMIKDELGDRWLRPDLFRFGASSLLTDIERQLEHYATGRYSAAHRHPLA